MSHPESERDFKAVLFSSPSLFLLVCILKLLIGFWKANLAFVLSISDFPLHFKGTPWESLELPDKLLYRWKSVQFLIKPQLIYFCLHSTTLTKLPLRGMSSFSAPRVCHLFLLCFATDKEKENLTSALEGGNAFKTVFSSQI